MCREKVRLTVCSIHISKAHTKKLFCKITELSTRYCRYSSVVFCSITINHCRSFLTRSQYHNVKTTLLFYLKALSFLCVQFSFQLIVYCFAVTVISTYYFVNPQMHNCVFLRIEMHTDKNALTADHFLTYTVRYALMFGAYSTKCVIVLAQLCSIRKFKQLNNIFIARLINPI